MPCCRLRLIAACLALAAFLLPGCKLAPDRQDVRKRLLAQPMMSSESVAMDIFFVRLPHQDRESYDAIWEEVDEQAVGDQVRMRLTENGFRVGIVGGQLPSEIQRLLDLQNAPRPQEDEAEAPQEGNLVKFDRQPAVRIRHLQIRGGKRGEIVASGIHPSVPLLYNEQGKVRGRSYEQCQGVLALRAFPEANHQARLQILPEVHYGVPRQRFTGDDGIWKLETGRPRRVFDRLAFEATVSPGEMIVVSSAADRPGSIGHYFFADSQGGGPQQRKLLFIRLAHAQEGDLFDDLPVE